MRKACHPPQQLADQHTLIAQQYAGYFVGHPYRAAQQRTDPGAIQVEWDKPWVEPKVVSDGCAFCERLTDEDAERRVAGYQHAIDIEVLRPRSLLYTEWLGAGTDEVREVEEIDIAGVVRKRGVTASGPNRRTFIERHGACLDVQPISMVALPLRLKRKLCIEWNHIYRDWLAENDEIHYDFESREFYCEVDQEEPAAVEEPKEWWHALLQEEGRAGGSR